MKKGPIYLLLRRAQPGTARALKRHINRGERIRALIETRWGRNHPNGWKAKHVRWYLETQTEGLANSTRYEHWLTVEVILAAIGRLEDWEPLLKGTWCHKTGRAGKGPGGRPPKRAHRAR